MRKISQKNLKRKKNIVSCYCCYGLVLIEQMYVQSILNEKTKKNPQKYHICVLLTFNLLIQSTVGEGKEVHRCIVRIIYTIMKLLIY